MSEAIHLNRDETARASLAASIFDLSRGRQALLSVAQPALGAVIALDGFPSLKVMAIGLVAATCGFLAVFSLNDVLDRKGDAEALRQGKAEFEGYDLDTAFLRHPLARGDLSLALSVTWVGGLAAIAAVLAYILAPAALALFGVAVILEVLYCALRSVTWAKTFVSGLMVGAGGLAGWVAVAALDRRAAIFFAFLALWEIAGRNLPNDLADVDVDGRVGIRTVATTFGNRASSRATFAGALLTLGVMMFLPMPLIAIAISAVAGVWSMLVPAILLLREPTSTQAARYFNRASLLPALVFVASVFALGLGL